MISFARQLLRPSWAVVVDTIARECAESPVERMVVVFYDRQMANVGVHVVAEGTETSVASPWRTIFDKGWRAGARYFVVGHNHPSGRLRQSPADEKFTRWIRRIGHLLDIDLLDHIIVGPAQQFGRGAYFSFYEQDLI